MSDSKQRILDAYWKTRATHSEMPMLHVDFWRTVAAHAGKCSSHCRQVCAAANLPSTVAELGAPARPKARTRRPLQEKKPHVKTVLHHLREAKKALLRAEGKAPEAAAQHLYNARQAIGHAVADIGKALE